MERRVVQKVIQKSKLKKGICTSKLTEEQRRIIEVNRQVAIHRRDRHRRDHEHDGPEFFDLSGPNLKNRKVSEEVRKQPSLVSTSPSHQNSNDIEAK